jgi:4-amino-4-deoxy-L-arabinose transferase-like glycosyltransferase
VNLSIPTSELLSHRTSSVSRHEAFPPWLWLTATLLLVAWFGVLEHRDLFNPDEGRYAEIAREMVATGDWVTPHLNDLKYFEKPPLQYWATAAAYLAFGEHTWTARLWPALLGFLGLLTTLLAGKTLFDVRTGVYAALLLASTLLYLVFAQVVTLDMGLTFFLSASLYCFLLALRTGLTTPRVRIWLMCAWVMAAMAVLSKGLVGVLLPGLTLLAYAAIQRDWRLPRLVLSLPGIVAFVAIVAPWFVLVQQRNPEFFDFFFLGEHLWRFLLPDHHRPGAWYYFPVIALVGAMPWTTLVLSALPLAWRRQQTENSHIHVDRFLLLWVVVIIGFFSLSSSKLPGYILPILPALALLAARWSAQATPKQFGPHLIVGFVAGATMLVTAILFEPLRIHFMQLEPLRPLGLWLAIAGLLIAFAFAVARLLVLGGNTTQALAVASLFSVVAMQTLQVGGQNFAPQNSAKELVETARAKFGEFDSDAPFYSVRTYDQTLPYLLHRTVTLVAYADEMALGLRMEPQKGIRTMDDFNEQWRNTARGYAVMPPRVYEDEVASGTPMRLMGRSARLVLVQR